MISHRVVFVLSAFFLLVTGFALSSSLSDNQDGVLNEDYYGYFHYFPQTNNTYYFYINSTARTITFAGINESNSHHIFVLPLDSANHFSKRVNYVWYEGWFDNQNLYMDQYIPTGIVHSDIANEVSLGEYYSDFVIANMPYIELNNVTLDVTLNTNNDQSMIESVMFPQLNSQSFMSLVWAEEIGAHAYGPVLLETKLTSLQNQSMIELGVWVKEDLIRNGLNPQWTNQLHLTNGFSISLISPSNSQIFQIPSTSEQVEFRFMLNNYSFNDGNYPDCLVHVIGASDLELVPTLNEATGVGIAGTSLEIGSYTWKVSCNNELFTSDNSIFSLEQIVVVPEGPRVTEEGGRRRVQTTQSLLQNLSLGNTPEDNEEKAANNSVISLITGAVVGTLGNKTLFAALIFILVAGGAALVIYNRERLGIVKKK